jgi:hypothetical protein
MALLPIFCVARSSNETTCSGEDAICLFSTDRMRLSLSPHPRLPVEL